MSLYVTKGELTAKWFEETMKNRDGKVSAPVLSDIKRFEKVCKVENLYDVIHDPDKYVIEMNSKGCTPKSIENSFRRLNSEIHKVLKDSDIKEYVPEDELTRLDNYNAEILKQVDGNNKIQKMEVEIENTNNEDTEECDIDTVDQYNDEGDTTDCDDSKGEMHINPDCLEASIEGLNKRVTELAKVVYKLQKEVSTKKDNDNESQLALNKNKVRDNSKLKIILETFNAGYKELSFEILEKLANLDM